MKLHSYIGIAVAFVLVSSLCTLLHPSTEDIEKEKKHTPDLEIKVSDKEIAGLYRHSA